MKQLGSISLDSSVRSFSTSYAGSTQMLIPKLFSRRCGFSLMNSFIFRLFSGHLRNSARSLALNILHGNRMPRFE